MIVYCGENPKRSILYAVGNRFGERIGRFRSGDSGGGGETRLIYACGEGNTLVDNAVSGEACIMEPGFGGWRHGGGH